MLFCTRAGGHLAKMTQNGRSTEVREQGMRNVKIKRSTEEEKSSGVSVNLQSGGVWPTVRQRASQEGGWREWPPCLNPTDRSPCLTGDGNQ